MADNVVMKKHAVELAFARNWRPQTDDDKCITELAAEIVRLCQQIAELEPDAKLGRMVREMPASSLLCHEAREWGEWYAELPVGKWFFDKEYGATPEETLEAANKEKDGGSQRT